MKRQDHQKLVRAAQLLRAVAHPARIEIINLLRREKRLSVGGIQAGLGISQSMTSQHLGALKRAGALSCRKQANVCYYFIHNKNVLKLLECVSQCVAGG